MSCASPTIAITAVHVVQMKTDPWPLGLAQQLHVDEDYNALICKFFIIIFFTNKYCLQFQIFLSQYTDPIANELELPQFCNKLYKWSLKPNHKGELESFLHPSSQITGVKHCMFHWLICSELIQKQSVFNCLNKFPLKRKLASWSMI